MSGDFRVGIALSPSFEEPVATEGIFAGKGQKISLQKETQSTLGNVMMGLGWDQKKPEGFWATLFSSGTAIDLDASCLMLDADKKLVDVVWFRQLNSKDGSIHHSRMRASVIRDETGIPSRILGVNWDITLLKQAAEEMQIALKKESEEEEWEAKSDAIRNRKYRTAQCTRFH